jgi:hypothetical protein
VYYDPDEHCVLAHSIGLQQGFLGVVNGFGGEKYDGRNNVVLAQEMLHILGASGRYDPRTNQALFPEGFAQPGRSPRYPQVQAGRIPQSATKSKMPNSLKQIVIGRTSAVEIGWVK